MQTSHGESWSLQAGAEQLGEGQQVAMAAGHILVTFYELSRLGSFPVILSSLSSLATPQAHGFLGETGKAPRLQRCTEGPSCRCVSGHRRAALTKQNELKGTFCRLSPFSCPEQ